MFAPSIGIYSLVTLMGNLVNPKITIRREVETILEVVEAEVVEEEVEEEPIAEEVTDEAVTEEEPKQLTQDEAAAALGAVSSASAALDIISGSLGKDKTKAVLVPGVVSAEVEGVETGGKEDTGPPLFDLV